MSELPPPPPPPPPKAADPSTLSRRGARRGGPRQVNPFLPHHRRAADLDEISVSDASRPFVVDVGCGDGRWCVAAAARYRGCNFVGVDLREGAVDAARDVAAAAAAAAVAEEVGGGGDGAAADRSSNVAFLRCNFAVDAQRLLERCARAEGGLAAICFQFPDPWWRRREQKRRLITSEVTPTRLVILGVKKEQQKVPASPPPPSSPLTSLPPRYRSWGRARARAGARAPSQVAASLAACVAPGVLVWLQSDVEEVQRDGVSLLLATGAFALVGGGGASAAAARAWRAAMGTAAATTATTAGGAACAAAGGAVVRAVGDDVATRRTADLGGASGTEETAHRRSDAAGVGSEADEVDVGGASAAGADTDAGVHAPDDDGNTGHSFVIRWLDRNVTEVLTEREEFVARKSGCRDVFRCLLRRCDVIKTTDAARATSAKNGRRTDICPLGPDGDSDDDDDDGDGEAELSRLFLDPT